MVVSPMIISFSSRFLWLKQINLLLWFIFMLMVCRFTIQWAGLYHALDLFLVCLYGRAGDLHAFTSMRTKLSLYCRATFSFGGSLGACLHLSYLLSSFTSQSTWKSEYSYSLSWLAWSGFLLIDFKISDFIINFTNSL